MPNSGHLNASILWMGGSRTVFLSQSAGDLTNLPLDDSMGEIRAYNGIVRGELYHFRDD